MEPKDAKTIQSELIKPFAPEDLEWRLQRTFSDKGRGIAVPYVTNRAIQSRLDNVVGVDNWYNEFRPWHGTDHKDAQICGISIYFPDRGFVTKWDGAEDSDIEPVKGGLSDSMKRAAVQWGIGRVLYNMSPVYVNVEQRGKTWFIQKGQEAIMNKAYLDMLSRLKLAPAVATGLQASAAAPQQQYAAQPAATPAQANAGQSRPAQSSSAGNTIPFPKLVPQYQVRAVQPQQGMNGTNTQVLLMDRNSKQVSAFAWGTHPQLVPGALLANVKLTTRTQDTVVFQVLESYQVVKAPNAA